MPLSKLILLVVAVLAPMSVADAQSPAAIAWQTDLDAARAKAEKEQKLLLVHFYNDSCGPCRMLDATVFNQPKVAGVVHSQFVPVKLNTNEFPATAERFGITRVPTDVVITPQGRMVERMVSPATPMAYIGRMSGVAKQFKQQSGRDFSTAGSNFEAATQPTNPAYSGLTVPAEQNALMGVNVPKAVEGLATNPYAQAASAATVQSQQQSPAPAVDPLAVSNPYANQPITPIEETQPAATDRYAAAASPLQQSPTAQSDASSATATAPQLPANSPPLGFFGYCPVTMKKENRWQQGDVRWGCYHRGRTYLFASQQARDEFLKAGDLYAPALSGIDPVLAIDGNQAVEGKQEFGIEFQDQFYLFSSEDNLRKFFNRPQHYATGVRQAMNALPEGRELR